MPIINNAKPGERLCNDHFDDRFTCPNCLTDHELQGSDEPKFISCECGARLRCEVEQFDSAVCIIADPDEEED
jgi:transcription elongation factor Elf1